jgi:hypothetical protein
MLVSVDLVLISCSDSKFVFKTHRRQSHVIMMISIKQLYSRAQLRRHANCSALIPISLPWITPLLLLYVTKYTYANSHWTLMVV